MIERKERVRLEAMPENMLGESKQWESSESSADWTDVETHSRAEMIDGGIE